MGAATVFYSWQSDLPKKTNRTLLEEALRRAAKALANDDSVEIAPVVERDTQGLPGAPDIHLAIMEKIRTADMAVFDVSIVHRGGRRLHPNPNVLIELGYAIGVLGWDRIVLVMNIEYGEIGDLPFDIKTKKTLAYRMKEEQEPGEARRALQKMFEGELRTILAHRALKSRLRQVDGSIEALQEQKPGASALVRKTLEVVVRELSEKQPAQVVGEPGYQALLRGYEETAPRVGEITSLVIGCVEAKNADAFLVLLEALEDLAAAQGPRVAGTIRAGQFDIQRCIMQELLAVIAGTCLKYRCWELLLLLVSHHFKFTHEYRERSGSFEVLRVEPEALEVYESANNCLRGTGLGSVLRERYAGRGSSGLAFKDLREGDFFLYVCSDLRGEEDGYVRWRPGLFVHEKREHMAIDWVRRLESERFMAGVAKATGLMPDVFVSRYKKRWLRILNVFSRSWLTDRDLKWMLLDPAEVASAG